MTPGDSVNTSRMERHIRQVEEIHERITFHFPAPSGPKYSALLTAAKKVVEIAHGSQPVVSVSDHLHKLDLAIGELGDIVGRPHAEEREL
jgi:hypothetical protein